MMAGQPRVVVAFAQALTELVTVEKKHIVVLTEVARDTLRTEPLAAPALATLVTTRIVQAPPPQKLPALYLLDSISKLVGEPFKTLFAPGLPEAFMSTWHTGGAGLLRPLEKLLGTWSGVFPAPLVADIQARMAAAQAAVAAAAVPMYAAAAAGGAGAGYGYSAVVPAAPMAADPRLQVQQQQQQQPAYGGYPSALPQAAPVQPQPAYYQQQPAAAAYPAPQAQVQPAEAVSVPDLLSSLMNAGLLAAPGAAPAAAPAGGAPPQAFASGPPASTATPEREQPPSTSFTPDRVKEHNPSALARLLRLTEATKHRFLDRKFLRRQQKAAGATARASRFWYLDLPTWQTSTTGAAAAGGGPAAEAGAGAGSRAAAAAAAAAELEARKPQSVPVDDSQTVCALSGEAFEQFWSEQHQEWRFRNAKQLDAEEAASYGLEEGAIVLVSALGHPDVSVLQQPAVVGGGVVSELAARQEIAADLAAAMAAAAAGSAEEAGAGGAAAAAADEKDEKPELSALAGEGADAAAAAEAEPPEKRQRVG